MIQLEYQELTLKAGNIPVLDQIDLRIDGPGVFAFLGPSGAGKSSLLRITQRLITHGEAGWCHKGDICFNGKSIFHPNVKPHELARQIGYIPQRPRALQGSVQDNVEFALRHTTRLSRTKIQTIAVTTLEQVGLVQELPNLKTAAWKLSGGQTQRLAIARALALNPTVLMMDEPTTGLDPLNVEKLETVIRQQAQQRLVILVTHDVDIAERLADSVGFILPGPTGGRLVETGPTSHVFDQAVNAEVRTFITSGRSGPKHRGESITQPPIFSNRPLATDQVRDHLIGLGLLLLQKVYLFICDGNRSRSPMAQAICNHAILQFHQFLGTNVTNSTFHTISAGLKTNPGQPMSHPAQTVLKDLGITPHPHKTCEVSHEMVQQASTIFCMTQQQCQEMVQRFPHAANRIQPLDANGDIENPKGHDIHTFQSVAEQIQTCVRQRLTDEVSAVLSI